MTLDNISIHFDKKSNLPSDEGGAAYSVAALYLSCLEKYITEETRKIVIQTTSDASKEDEIDDLLNVVLIYKIFNFEKYQSCNKFEKRKILLDVLQSGLLHTARSKGWDILALNDAYNCCIAKKLEHKWLREERYILSPDRKHYAGIFCIWDSYKFKVFTIFLNKEKQEIKREKLYESHPAYVDPMGKMKWDKESASTFILFSKDGKQKWQANL